VAILFLFASLIDFSYTNNNDNYFVGWIIKVAVRVEFWSNLFIGLDYRLNVLLLLSCCGSCDDKYVWNSGRQIISRFKNTPPNFSELRTTVIVPAVVDLVLARLVGVRNKSPVRISCHTTRVFYIFFLKQTLPFL
jgi:hypothetical protein